MLSKKDWKVGDIVALSQTGRDKFLSWERAVVVEPAFDGDGGGYALSVRHRASKMVGILTSEEVAGRWVVDTGSARKLTRLQKWVLQCLRERGSQTDSDLARFCSVGVASARSRIAELRKLGYDIKRTKEGFYYV